MATGEQKGQFLYQQLLEKERKQEEENKTPLPDLIISADTIVVHPSGEILEKPQDESHALEMLRSLNGFPHQVITGVSFLRPSSPTPLTFCETTQVYLGPVSEETLLSYTASGEWEGRAGGYAIQGLGGSLIQKIEGCYYNVVGLPLHKLGKELIDYLTKPIS